MKHFYLISLICGLVSYGFNAAATRTIQQFPKLNKSVTRAKTLDASLDIYSDKISYGEYDKEALIDIEKGKDVAVVYYRVVNDRAETEVEITRTEANSFTVPLKTHGAYTVIAAGFDADEDLANPLEYTECYFYYEPDDKDNWIPLGTGTMTDDFVASIFSDLDPLTFPVEVERNKLREGQIRLVNPYGAPYCKALEQANVSPYAYKADLINNHYLYFDISDPEFVYMSEGYTGLRLLDHDVLLIGCFGKYFLDEGKSKNEIKFAQYNGMLADNTITFYQYALYTMWHPDYEISSANYNEAFSLTLPEGAGIGSINSDIGQTIKYYTLQGVEIQQPLHGIPYIKVENGKSTKYLKK